MRVLSLMGVVVIGWLVSPTHAAPPNVVLIISDDQGWSDYSFMGHEAIRTPNIDRLALQGLTFTRGYVPTSLCRPSLVSIITGLYPHQHKVTGNDPTPPKGQSGYKLRQEGDPAYTALLDKMSGRIKSLATLPRLLGEAGYLSLQTGKWWEGDPRDAGFTHSMTHGAPKRGGRHGDEGLKIGREGMKPISDFLDLAAEKGKPFLIWYAPMMPHLPHDPPTRLLEKYTAAGRPEPVARYYAMCEWFDETCGELLGDLEKRGLAENTLVVYVTDNGWVQPDKVSDAFGGPKGKRSPYEGGVRTPIILKLPGGIAPRRDESVPVSSIDLTPTILAACGLSIPNSMPGVNLLDAKALSLRPALFGEIYTHDVHDLDNPAASLRFRWCVEGDWKLILPHALHEPGAKPELYDLSADPRERVDLSDAHADRVGRLHDRIEAWWAVP